MRWSKFVYKVPHNGGIIVLNTMNSAMISLDKDSYEALSNNLLNGTSDETLTTLVKMGFIVEDSFDEMGVFLQDSWSEWEKDDIVKVVLLSTTGCNFSCSYCYENGINRALKLTEEMGETLLSYLSGLLQEHTTIKKVYILLFGGEPTLNWETVTVVAKNIMHMCESRNVEFASGIVTNGYLLDERKVEDLIDLKCDSIQITLDGPKEVHDKRKYLFSGKGTFDTILRNMHGALKNGCVSAIDLRINVDIENLDYISNLLDYLQLEFASNQLNISIGIVSATVKNNEYAPYGNAIPAEHLSTYLCELLELVSSHGFAIQDFYSFDGLCILKSKYSFALSPDGRIYRCLSMVGRESLSVGKLQDISSSDELAGFFTKDMYKPCVEKECEFLPLCHTGCKFDALVEHGVMTQNSCKYDQYCSVNQFLMQRLDATT